MLEKIKEQFNRVQQEHKDIADLVLKKQPLQKDTCFGCFLIDTNEIHLSEQQFDKHSESFWLTVVLHESCHALQWRNKVPYRNGKMLTKAQKNSYFKHGAHYHMIELQADSWARIIYNRFFSSDYKDNGHFEFLSLHANHLRFVVNNRRKHTQLNLWKSH